MPTLRFTDWIGNRMHRLLLPYNYHRRRVWMAHFADCGFAESTWTTKVPLYLASFSHALGLDVNFIALPRKV
jgi:hypothetical protein